MNKEVEDAFNFSKIVYFTLTTCVAFLLLITDSPLNHDDDFEDNLAFTSIYFLLLVISAYLFLNCGENPGWVKLPESADTSLEKRNISAKYRPPFEYCKNEEILNNLDEVKNSIRTNSLESIEDLKEAIEMNQIGEAANKEYNKNIKKGSMSESSDSLLNDEISGLSIPPKHYCKTCRMEQEYRTRHCHKCQKCIYKYDHHCFWIGGCVGELNHRKFFLFLLFQSIVHLWTFYMIYKSIHYYDGDEDIDDEEEENHDHEKKGNQEQNYPYYEYIIHGILGFVVFCFSFFTGVLFLYHCYLVSTNQTSWEHSKRDKIAYMKIYPRGYSPFNLGLVNNIRAIFFHNGEIRKWTLPNVLTAREQSKNQFNLCENDYYSCC